MFLIREWLNMFREGDVGFGIFFGVLGLIVLLFTVALTINIIDYSTGHNKNIQVTVLEKIYSPSHSSTGTGVGVGGGGQVGMVVTSNSEAEKYILIVRDKDGSVFSHEVDAASYAKSAIGVDYVITIRIGGLIKRRR